MQGSSYLHEIFGYVRYLDSLEILGLVTGLLAVWWLIKQNILTWPAGIIYIVASLIIFWREKLYADFALHVFFLGMNVYGWYYWVYAKKSENHHVPVTSTYWGVLIILTFISFAGIVLAGYFLSAFTDAALPYWDSATTVLSITGMWLTARKKIENWYFWLVVDILATGIYFYKGIYFYSVLYMIYIVLAVSGYLSWKSTMNKKIVQC